MRARALGAGLPPKKVMVSPSLASVRPAMALSQMAKEALSLSTRMSLGSVSLVGAPRGGCGPSRSVLQT